MTVIDEITSRNWTINEADDLALQKQAYKVILLECMI